MINNIINSKSIPVKQLVALHNKLYTKDFFNSFTTI